MRTPILLASLFLGTVLPAAQGDEYFLIPGASATVAVDGRLSLAVMTAAPDGSLTPSAAGLLTGVAWTVNGKPIDQQDPANGTLLAGMVLDRIVYTAPHTVPARNPVAVSVTFKPGAGSKQITLVCNVTIRNAGNFVSLDGPNMPPSRYALDDRYSSPQMRNMMARGMSVGPVIQINIAPMTAPTATPELPAMASASMTLLIAGKAPGRYDWSLPGSSATTVMVMIGATQYLSADCRPHGSPNCQTVPLEGYTQITAVDPATHEVRGMFQGRLVRIVSGKLMNYVAVSGGFNAAVIGAPGLHPAPAPTTRRR